MLAALADTNEHGESEPPESRQAIMRERDQEDYGQVRYSPADSYTEAGDLHVYRVVPKYLMHLRHHASRSAIGVFLLRADVCLKTRRISISRCADKCYNCTEQVP